MRVIAIEEHFLTPLYREHVSANEYRNFYLTSRGAAMGHDIIAENMDIGAKRIAHMDAHGVDLQVLSFGSPGPQAFGAEVAMPMARDANDRMHAAVQRETWRRRWESVEPERTAQRRSFGAEWLRAVQGRERHEVLHSPLR